MDSTGSSTNSTAPPAATSLQSLAIRAEGNRIAQQSPTSSRALSSVPNMVVIPEFKCRYCPAKFTTTRGRGLHQAVHLRQFRRLSPDGPQLPASSSSSSRTRLQNFPSSADSGVVPLFAGTGGLAPAQPSSAATGGGGHVGISRQVNQETTAQYYSWLRSVAVPLFVSQTQTGSVTGGLPQPSLAAPAPVAEGSGGSGDGVNLGGLQDMPEVNQEEETTDGIDLTLRL